MVEGKGFAISLQPDKLRTIKSPLSSVTDLTFQEFDNIAQSIDTTTLYDLRLRTTQSPAGERVRRAWIRNHSNANTPWQPRLATGP
jgi:hypothetical protein